MSRSAGRPTDLTEERRPLANATVIVWKEISPQVRFGTHHIVELLRVHTDHRGVGHVSVEASQLDSNLAVTLAKPGFQAFDWWYPGKGPLEGLEAEPGAFLTGTSARV